MTNPQGGGQGNGIWPPPRIRYMLRTLAFASAAASAGAAFSGHLRLAGILAVFAAALQLVDIIGGP